MYFSVSSSLLLFLSKTCLWVILPNTLRWEMSGFLPLYASCVLFPHTLLVGLRFDKYTTHETSYVQNSLGNFLLLWMLLVIFKIILFFLLVTTFCWGDLATLVVFEFHFLHQNFEILLMWTLLHCQIPRLRSEDISPSQHMP